MKRKEPHHLANSETGASRKTSRKLKSAVVQLGLLTSIAMTYVACKETPPPANPYSEYNYYGHASDPGMVYSHYHQGAFNWFLLSRMFNGYGYYPPTYRPHYGSGMDLDSSGGFGRRHFYPGMGYHGGGYYPGYYSMSNPSSSGYVSSAHVARGGFGSSGYGHGASA